MTRKLNAFLIAASLFIGTSVSHAGFDIITDDELENDPNRYGRAHTLGFHRALKGDEEVSLNEDTTLNDQSNVTSELPKIGHTGFASVHLGRPKTKLKKLKNAGSSTDLTTTFNLSQAEESDNLFNLSVARGYRWVRWAVDAELLLTEGIDVSFSPLFQGTAYSMNSSVNAYALFFNIHYFVPRFYSWIPEAVAPHLNFGLGPDYKRVKTQVLQNNAALGAKTKNSLNIGFNLGVGLAYRITHHFLVDLTWRYIDLGTVKLGPVKTTVAGAQTDIGVKAKDFRSSGFHIGLLYELN